MLAIIYNGNDPALLTLSTLEALNADDHLLSNLKGAFSSCNFYLMRILIGGKDKILRSHLT